MQQGKRSEENQNDTPRDQELQNEGNNKDIGR